MRGFLVLAVAMAAWTSTASANTSTAVPVAPEIAAERLALANQYVVLSHREEFQRRTYEKELELSWRICRNRPCQPDLDRAIAEAERVSAQSYTRQVVQLYARRLSVSELRALVRFYESPDGQAIIDSQDGMTDELSQIGYASALGAHADILRRFCPSHPQTCLPFYRKATAPRSRGGPMALALLAIAAALPLVAGVLAWRHWRPTDGQ